MTAAARKQRASRRSPQAQSPAERIWVPRLKSDSGLTAAQIRKAVDAVIAKREKRGQGG